MEVLSSAMLNPWFTDMDMEDSLLLQEFIGDCLVDYSPSPEDMGTLVTEELHHSPSSASDSNSSTATAAAEAISSSSPAAKRKMVDDHPSPAEMCSNQTDQKGSDPGPGSSDDRHGGGRSTSSTKKPKRLPEQCHNHIIAERQRRQTLSQRFIALSALIPGLKKMDKTSVLGEAINHMKQLKDRLKALEEENAKRAVESVVVVRRSRVVVENESSTSNSDSDSGSGGENVDDKQLPEIEARFSNKSILVKIHCEMQKGVLVKLMTEIERLHLSVTSSHAMPFTPTTHDITIVAQMEVEFNMTPQEVVKALRMIFR